ncbi:spore coat protein [Desertibacillus haloalkaliphilus]|uniref:spore coat protein n=1 Tax=Desertibacillus haloalkaliphilus TaxID=1328930 RepID=UPI001C27D6E2|nr:spore coat protein [Desertibacillus haloalkaliphilus]MBU8907892.1 spore coat protein [Desertibacillus haloalkaliphilus]
MTINHLNATDHVIATDMLFEAKAAIKDIATAITESTSSEVHSFLAKELRTAIYQHEQIYGFLQEQGIYDAYNVLEQINKDIGYAAVALNE